MRIRVIGIGIAAALTVAAPASAATIQVTDNGDGLTGCTLRAAINAANGSGPTGTCAAGDPDPATDRIELPANLQFTATSLGAGEDANATGDLDILENVDIVSQGAAITGSGDRVIDIHGAAVQITGATISGGVTADGEGGGGIDSVGVLTLTNSVVSGNRTGGGATGAPGAGGEEGGSGGGIRSDGRLTLEGTTVRDNSAGDGGSGGGVSGDPLDERGGPGGAGGGIYAVGHALTVRKSTIEDNTSGDGGDGGSAIFESGARGGDGGFGGGVAASGVTVSISGSTVRGNATGRGGDSGGAFFASEPGGGGGEGGGVSQDNGTLSVTGTTVSDNHAGEGGAGGEVQSGAGAAGGEGGSVGGIAASVSTLAVSSSRIAGNTAGDGGMGGIGGGDGGDGGLAGGLGLSTDGPSTISETTFDGNRAGNGGAGGDSPTGGRGGVAGSGGGIYATGAGTLDIRASTVSANAAGDGGPSSVSTDAGTPTPAAGFPGEGGGLIVVGFTASVSNSTFSGNAAGRGGTVPSGGAEVPDTASRSGGSGGAIGAGGNGHVAIRSSTIASNAAGAGGAGPNPGSDGAGGGVVHGGAAADSFSIENTLLASNVGGNCVGANVTDGGHNVDFPDSADCAGTDADPKLGPLQDNGGPTFTRAIGTDGAAIDQVPASGAGCLATDQRGHARPERGACDIGALEAGADPVPPPGPGGDTPPTGTTPPVSTEPTRLTVRLTVRRQKLLRALRRGYSARFDANRASKAVLEVWVEGRQARGLKPAARKRVRVARGARRLTEAGRRTVTARFTRTSRTVLKRRSNVRVLVKLTVTDTSGRTSVKSTRRTLRR
jgi:CSLREA domain-containing protein